MIKAYIILHHNLAFSSIPEKHYKYIIKNVYLPFLSIAKDFPLGLEFNGQTLDIISQKEPIYLDKFNKALSSSYVELIGSSYSQAIFPLIPARVNMWNLNFGIDTYLKFFKLKPKIALLNEQVYSESILNLYKKAGYEAIIFDWMNAIKDNSWPGHYRFIPVYHNPSNLYILWSDCIIFQKFQRVVWNELDVDEWIRFISSLIENALITGLNEEDINICLYASDAEVFDYKPRSIGSYSYKKGEIDKIFKLLSILKDKLSIKLVLPSDIINKNDKDNVEINHIATASYPLRTKKQDKYNVTRWAITGREATRMNTQCHKLLYLIDKIEKLGINSSKLEKLKKDLVILWGSDFRTHTIDEKFEFFRHKMGHALYEAKKLLKIEDSFAQNNLLETWKPLKNDSTNAIKINGRRLSLRYLDKKIVLLLNKGLAIESFTDKSVSTKPILGTIAHGFFDDISLGSDFFSGHFILLTHEGRQVSDLSLTMDDLEFFKDDKQIAIRNRTPKTLPNLELIKTISLNSKGLKIGYDFYAKDLRPASLRLGIITVLPEAFDINSLFFKTHQGGLKQEIFYLKGSKVLQDQPVNHIVTSKHCLGFSEATITIGDKKKEIEIKTDPKTLYCVPLFHFEEVDKSLKLDIPRYFCRVYFSICERDDVAQVLWKGPISISFSISTYIKD